MSCASTFERHRWRISARHPGVSPSARVVAEPKRDLGGWSTGRGVRVLDGFGPRTQAIDRGVGPRPTRSVPRRPNRLTHFPAFRGSRPDPPGHDLARHFGSHFGSPQHPTNVHHPGMSTPPTAFPLVGGPSSVSTQSAPEGIRTPNRAGPRAPQRCPLSVPQPLHHHRLLLRILLLDRSEVLARHGLAAARTGGTARPWLVVPPELGGTRHAAAMPAGAVAAPLFAVLGWTPGVSGRLVWVPCLVHHRHRVDAARDGDGLPTGSGLVHPNHRVEYVVGQLAGGNRAPAVSDASGQLGVTGQSGPFVVAGQVNRDRFVASIHQQPGYPTPDPRRPAGARNENESRDTRQQPVAARGGIPGAMTWARTSRPDRTALLASRQGRLVLEPLGGVLRDQSFVSPGRHQLAQGSSMMGTGAWPVQDWVPWIAWGSTGNG